MAIVDVLPEANPQTPRLETGDRSQQLRAVLPGARRARRARPCPRAQPPWLADAVGRRQAHDVTVAVVVCRRPTVTAAGLSGQQARNTSLDSRRPRGVSRSRPSTCRQQSVSSAQARPGREQGVVRQRRPRCPPASRSPRMAASLRASARVQHGPATGRQPRRAAVPGQQRRELAVESGRVPAPRRDPVEGVGTRSRPPRSAGDASSPGCGGSRAPAGRGWTARSGRCPPRPGASSVSASMSAARSSSWARRRPLRQRRAPVGPAGGRHRARSGRRRRDPRASARTSRRGQAPGRSPRPGSRARTRASGPGHP